MNYGVNVRDGGMHGRVSYIADHNRDARLPQEFPFLIRSNKCSYGDTERKQFLDDGKSEEPGRASDQHEFHLASRHVRQPACSTPMSGAAYGHPVIITAPSGRGTRHDTTNAFMWITGEIFA